MKNIISALFLVLLAASAAKAEPVDRGDLYGTCIESQNKKWKEGLGGTLKLFTTAQLKQLEPYHLESIRQRCDCTVKEAFKHLSQDTIQAFNSSLEKGNGEIISSNSKASKEFRETGMMDKQIACAAKSLQSSGFDQEMQKLSK